MIHQYKNNGYNIVLDVNSGSIHVVDDVVYDVLSLMDEENVDRYGEAEFSRIADVILKNDYKEEVTKEDLKDVFSDLQELEENGTLFTKDVYKEGVIDFKKRQTVVKALLMSFQKIFWILSLRLHPERNQNPKKQVSMIWQSSNRALLYKT